MAVNDGEKASAIFAADRSGRRGEILRCQRQGLALPHPGFKSGTFYLAEKRNFLLCVDITEDWCSEDKGSRGSSR